MKGAFAMAVGAVLFFYSPAAHGAASEAKHFIVDVISINGEEFVVKDETGKESKIYVGADTEKYGHVKTGDRIEAWVFPDGHAKTILILRSASTIQEDRKREESQRAGVQPEEGRQVQR